MKTENKNKLVQISMALLWTCVGAGGLALLVAAVNKKNIKKCTGIHITITGPGNNFFIDKKDVRSIITKYAGGPPEGKAIEKFDLMAIEKALVKDVWIKKAELFFDNNDVLRASIDEREPIARVFTQNGNSFYIDSSRKMLPLVEKFSARLPVFTGFPTDALVLSRRDSNLLKDIKTISLLIQEDPFMMAMIDQVDITAARTFEMVPKIGNQLIVFGDVSGATEKFRKLKLFYKNVIVKTGWGRYNRIDLQYNNQVVARIRGKEDVMADSIRTIQLMKMLAVRAARQASDSIRTFLQDNVKNTADSSIILHSMQRDEAVISNTTEKTATEEPPPKSDPVIKNKAVAKPGNKTVNSKSKSPQ